MFLKISQILRENTLLESLYNKVTGVRARNFVKKKFQHRCFPVKFEKSLRAPILTEHLQWLRRLLHFLSSLLCYLFM